MRIATFATALLATLALATPASAAAAANAAAPAGSTVIAPTVITEDGLCDVTATIQGQWSTGYAMGIAIRNISTVPVTWRASATLPPGSVITQAWNVMVTQSGSYVSIFPSPWGPFPGGLLQPGQTYNFGYVGTGPVVLPVVVCSRAG